MAPTLYHITPSPPARAVRMVAKAIGLELNLKQIDLLKGEHLSEWFLKINPQHTVPTFVDDDGFILWDSHAIMSYIVSKYAKDDSLYPTDLKKRAVIDQRMYFEAGVVFTKLGPILRPLFFENKREIENKAAKFEAIESAYSILETFLEGHNWVAGDSVTIADFSLIPIITSLAIFKEVDEKRFPKIVDWLKRAKELPVYDINETGLEAHKAAINKLLSR